MLHALERCERHLYDASTYKWSAVRKRAELAHVHHRYLLVRHVAPQSSSSSSSSSSASASSLPPPPPIAFLAFRWDLDDGRPVMYVYELFVRAAYRRRGLAVALMRCAETLCRAASIPYIVLTVFSANEPALNLYRHKLA
ncbi:unnamed protein product [Agarophyton chilense]